MPILFLKTIEYEETLVDTSNIELILKIDVDDADAGSMERDLAPGARWILDHSITFQNKVKLSLFDEDLIFDDLLGRVDIGDGLTRRHKAKFTKTSDTLILWYEVFSEDENRAASHHPQIISFRQLLGRMGSGALEPAQHQQLLRARNRVASSSGGSPQILLDPSETRLYKCSEHISVRDVLQRHASQDGTKSESGAMRSWIYQHCLPSGEEAMIPAAELPNALTNAKIAFGAPNWIPVQDERSRFLAGFQEYARRTVEDNPLQHATMDWNWDIIADPAFMYLHVYTSKNRILANGDYHPIMHNEWETGSLPIQWRPFWGEYITVWGRHIYDLGHAPISAEIHPAHTIVREHTTAAPLGDNDAMVPVNRAVIGMGSSGGFPGNAGGRWQEELDVHLPGAVAIATTAMLATTTPPAASILEALRSNPFAANAMVESFVSSASAAASTIAADILTAHASAIAGFAAASNSPQIVAAQITHFLKTSDCWFTNLRRHPLRCKLFPPVNRPHATSELRARVVLAEIIETEGWSEMLRFLQICRADPPAGSSNLGFRRWDRGAGFPSGFLPVEAAGDLRPRLTLRDGYFDVEVDLSEMGGIPAGYYAIIECGWSDRGNHKIDEFDVTFEQLQAEAISDTSNAEWHLYYGVNGEWDAIWTEDDAVSKPTDITGSIVGDPQHNRTFRVRTVDNMPLVIRDCGIELDPLVEFENDRLDRVEITAPGPDYFDRIEQLEGVQVDQRTADTLSFEAKGWLLEDPERDTGGEDRHFWKMRITQRSL